MLKPHCCFLLILLMIVTPVTSAFAPCEIISSEISTLQKMDDACLKVMSSQLSDKAKPQPFCYLSGYCSFHFYFPATFKADLYGHSNTTGQYFPFNAPPLNTFSSPPELKPPIT